MKNLTPILVLAGAVGIAATVALSTACESRHADAGKAASVSEERTAQTSQTTRTAEGTSACNDYFRMVSRCIETKMPESERASERQNLETTRSALESPLVQTMAADECKKRIHTAIQQDGYGCYAEEATRRGVQTACNLLTRAELEQILKTTLSDGMQDGFVCKYQYPLKTWHEPFTITVYFKGGLSEMEASRQALKFFKSKKPNSVGQLVAGETVKDVGDDAFITEAGIEPILAARLGDVAVSLLGGSPDQLKEVARKVLPRIKPEAKDEGAD